MVIPGLAEIAKGATEGAISGLGEVIGKGLVGAKDAFLGYFGPTGELKFTKSEKVFVEMDLLGDAAEKVTVGNDKLIKVKPTPCEFSFAFRKGDNWQFRAVRPDKWFSTPISTAKAATTLAEAKASKTYQGYRFYIPIKIDYTVVDLEGPEGTYSFIQSARVKPGGGEAWNFWAEPADITFDLQQDVSSKPYTTMDVDWHVTIKPGKLSKGRQLNGTMRTNAQEGDTWAQGDGSEYVVV
jgi:hypothetical protein